MNIKNQNAETIYNINGDMHLHSSPEVAELLNKDKQANLRELYEISFWDVLLKEYSGKKIIARNDELLRIREKLENTQQLILYGEPGLGKTTMLVQLAKELNNVIYISVKGKTPISIISYLTNKIRLANGDDLLELNDENNAFDWLQSSLQKSRHCFIIDDCEQASKTVNRIISLKKFDSTFLFATRNKTIFDTSNVSLHHCTPLRDNEVKLFLKTYNISLGTLEFNNILNASKGNPLYLFYFAHFKVSKLPDTLTNYQDSIWKSLTSTQQEILSIISISCFSITLMEISEILNCNAPLDFSKEMDNISALVKGHEGFLQIFHPSFSEFVFEILKQRGLLNYFQEKLGDYYLSKEKIVHATCLLLDIAPTKVDEYLLDVFPILKQQGKLDLALKVLKAKLNTVKKDTEKGYLYYHLYDVHQLLGNKEEATTCIDKSLTYLNMANHRSFYLCALMFKAIDLVAYGKVNEAIDIANTVFDNLKDDETSLKGPLLVSLSKVYVDLFEFKKGAEACKKAFEIFGKNDFVEGMIASLINLVTCLAQTDEYKDEAEKYGLRLLEIIEHSSNFLAEGIVLNALASIYRERKEYKKSKDFSSRAIKLCQEHKMKDKAILNLINFGNILRDEGNLDEAKKIYEEALTYAKEYKLKKEESRIYWILANISREAGDLNLSIDFADKSVICSQEVSFYYGIAHGLKEKAETLLLMNEPIKAANTLVDSAEYFKKMEQFSKSYQNNISEAIEIYAKAGEKVKANELINILIENTINEIDNIEIVDLILYNSSQETVASNFKKLFEKYFTNENGNLNVLKQFLSFSNYCKRDNESEGKLLFKKIIDLIIENLGKAKFSYSILGIAIEQSGFLLNQADLNIISESLQKKLPMYFVRNIRDGKITLSSIGNGINLEIHSFVDEVTCNKLITALILILHELPNLVVDKNIIIEKKCVLHLYLYSDTLNKELGKYLPDRKTCFDKNIQSLHSCKIDYKVPEIIIISPDFETYCNLNDFSDNKVSLYFFISAILGIKSHFYHSKANEDSTQRRFVLNSVAGLFAYTNLSLDDELLDSRFLINIDKIAASTVFSDVNRHVTL